MRFNWVPATLLLVALPMSWAQTTGNSSFSKRPRRASRAKVTHQSLPTGMPTGARRSAVGTHRNASMPVPGNKSTQSLDKQLSKLESQGARSQTAAPRNVTVKPLPVAGTQGKANASQKNPPINFSGKSTKRLASVTNSRASAGRRNVPSNTRLR